MTARPHGLADRRPSVTVPIKWYGGDFSVSVSVDLVRRGRGYALRRGLRQS